MESFRTALQLDEHLWQANVYLGRFYYDNKDYKQAEPYLLRAASAEPRNPQILMVLANTQVQNGEADQALANAEKVHSLPDHTKFAIAHLIAAQILNDSRRQPARAGAIQPVFEGGPRLAVSTSRQGCSRKARGRR